MICTHCNKPLTKTEIKFYENSCEGCEQFELKRYQAWRHGADDVELDALYDAPKPVLN